ncbi:MAG: 23S rRNA (adenine(2503)-C(2))-methyltransferase RlmN [Simkania sp.]|nr:23S rRNA (adenine(2503)-C(2))-methyltransferase RlmN [Simkania sp.]
MLGHTLEELQESLQELGRPKFRAAQIWKWVYEKGVTDWSCMTDLSQDLREAMQSQLQLETLRLIRKQDSVDGETTKFLWELYDGKLVESVLIRSADRRTVCVSSQVGCPARCAFCASGKQGLIRHLEAREITEQVYQIDRLLKAQKERVSHIVYMGMGEPMENYGNVLRSIRIMNDAKGLNISQRKMTVSTVGVVEGIDRFAKEGLQVNLVLSLHAPNQRLRQKLIPYARRYSLEDVLMAMRSFAKTTKRDITYEYTLMKDLNDQKEHAEELAELLKHDRCTVNLIPYNPVEGISLSRPPKESIILFREILEKKGINTTWRYTKGKDIAAACGQLALQEKIEHGSNLAIIE